MSVAAHPRIPMTPVEIEEFCVRNRIRKMALFGSVLTNRFRPESDIDVLVEFEPGSVPGFFGIVRMQDELRLRLGRDVDVRTPNGLSNFIRDRVVSAAAVVYERP